MITRRDLDAAIAECIGEREPNANTCIKLAAFYTIRQNLFPEIEQPAQSYSYAAVPDMTVHINSESDFARAVEGLPQDKVWVVIDELMQTIAVLQPKVYAAVMRKLNEI